MLDAMTVFRRIVVWLMVSLLTLALVATLVLEGVA
jgi:hypothetical protein